MGDEAARPPLQGLGEGRGQQGRGRARQHRLGARDAVELGVERLLHLDPLRRILLDMDDAVERVLETAGRAEAPAHLFRRRPVQQIVALQILQRLVDEGERLLRGGGIGIGDRHLMTGPRKADRPGPADESRADDGYLGHGFVRSLVA